MNISGRDWLFAGVVASVLGVLLLSNGTQKAPQVPDDDRDRPFQGHLAAGTGRMDVERECISCHSAQGTPLSLTHPPKSSARSAIS